jgi:hypothetical protein
LLKAIEKKLIDDVNELKTRMDDAKETCKKSIESLSNYREALKVALNEEDDSVVESKWRTVIDLFSIQEADTKTAKEKLSIAKYIRLRKWLTTPEIKLFFCG